MWYQAANWLFRDGKELIQDFLPGSSSGGYESNEEVLAEVVRLSIPNIERATTLSNF